MRITGIILLILASCSGKGLFQGDDQIVLNESQEYYAGRSACAKVFLKYKLLPKNDPLTIYVNQIGYTIALNSNRPHTFRGYHFGVLETDEINAMAFPSGFILVTTGILKQTRSEDEIAAVIAHEVAHVNLRHPEKAAIVALQNQKAAERAQKGLKFLLDVGSLLKVKEIEKLDEKDRQRLIKSFSATVDFLADAGIKGYGREQECEADAFGMQLLARAGYNPQAMKNFIERLKAVPPNPRLKDMLAGGTHPTPKERSRQLDDFLVRHSKNPNHEVHENLSTIKDESPRMTRFMSRTGGIR